MHGQRDMVPDDGLVGEVEHQALDEYDVLCQLHEVGLLSVSLSLSPAPIFRVIVQVPGQTIDKFGHMSHRDNFAFTIRYPRLFRRRRPYIAWPADADLPHHPGFRRAPLYYSSFTLERYIRWLVAPRPPRMRSMRERQATPRESDFPAVSLALLVSALLDRDYTSQKLSEANLGELFPGFIVPRRKFDIRPSKKTFEIKDQRGPTAIQSSEIRDITQTGQRFDTVDGAVNGVPLWVESAALRIIADHIEWGKTTQRNIVEQGGVLVGQPLRDQGNVSGALVTYAIPAVGAAGQAAYVKFDHVVWKRMLDERDRLASEGIVQDRDQIIGWYHTHPRMNVFMSGTDMNTQRSQFDKPWNYAIVLNPQQQLVACFQGGAATPAQLFHVDLGSTAAASRPLAQLDAKS